MKSKIFLFTLLALLILNESCKKSISSANNDPNSPKNVAPSALLATAEGTLAYTQGSDLLRFAGLFDQQLFSDPSFGQQTGAYYTYVVTDDDFDQVWGNMYTSVMENDMVLMHLADSTHNNAYSGVSRILMAYDLQLMVDSWGKVPYSTALLANTQGANIQNPTYDNDRALYDTIASLVNIGIAQLNDPDPGVLIPGREDVIYGGLSPNWLNLGPAAWIKFGHAIKARLYIHQSKGNAAMATNALAQIDSSFTSNADNSQYIFGTTETASGPVYQYNELRGTLDYPSSTLAFDMDSLTDPRYGVYFDSTYNDLEFVGLGSYYGSLSGHIEFITNDELLFMKSEAILRTTGDLATAQNYYDTAIIANMTKLGVDTAAQRTYLIANGTLPSTVDSAIAQVAFQEYIALFMNPEEWTTWRRTGSPVIVPTAGSNGVPRRFRYPNSEHTLNSANTPAATLFTPKIFWDN